MMRLNKQIAVLILALIFAAPLFAKKPKSKKEFKSVNGSDSAIGLMFLFDQPKLYISNSFFMSINRGFHFGLRLGMLNSSSINKDVDKAITDLNNAGVDVSTWLFHVPISLEASYRLALGKRLRIEPMIRGGYDLGKIFITCKSTVTNRELDNLCRNDISTSGFSYAYGAKLMFQIKKRYAVFLEYSNQTFNITSSFFGLDSKLNPNIFMVGLRTYWKAEKKKRRVSFEDLEDIEDIDNSELGHDE